MIIPNNLVNKRIRKELEKLSDKVNFEKNIVILNNKEYIIEISICNITIKFYISQYYPFKKPYKITINNILYIDILTNLHCDITKKMYNKMCLCCESILCRWSPTLKLENLIEEILKNIGYINSYYHKQSFRLLSANGGRYGDSPFLPDDICRLISTYLIYPTTSITL